jgi:EmrB/QacA subfamily drug resistance transporter
MRLMNIDTPQPIPPTLAPVAAHTHRMALLVMLSGTFMVVLDFFIVNVAIPSIQQELHANSGAIQMIVAGYGLATAAGLITGGRLGDMYGRRRMFAVGLAFFTLASALCGLAPNADALVAARILQGMAGAMLQPQVLAMLGLVFTGTQRTKAFAAYGLTLGLGAVGGQLIGGLLIQADIASLGWRTCFLINVPVGLVALVLTPRFIPSLEATGDSRLDLVGTVLVATGLVAVIWPLVEGRQQGWPLWSWFCLLCAMPVLLVFFLQQKHLAARGGTPLIAPSLFAEPAFITGLLISLIFYAGNASFYFVLAVYLQQGLGLSALESGLIFTALALGFFTTSVAASRLGDWLGRQSLTIGALVLAGGHLIQYAVVTSDVRDGLMVWMVPVLFIEGAGIGMVMAPMVSKVLAGLSPQHAGVASGVLATVQQVGNSLGVALIGLLFYGRLGSGSSPTSNLSAYAGALGNSLLYLLVLAVVVALLLQRLQPQPHKMVG